MPALNTQKPNMKTNVNGILFIYSIDLDGDEDNDIISVESPIGKALLGKSEGETVQIKVPAGTIEYEIIKISRD